MAKRGRPRKANILNVIAKEVAVLKQFETQADWMDATWSGELRTKLDDMLTGKGEYHIDPTNFTWLIRVGSREDSGHMTMPDATILRCAQRLIEGW